MTGLDYSIVILSLGLSFLFARYRNADKTRLPKLRSHTDESDAYLLAGRQLSLPLFVASLVASWYGGLIGVTEIIFSDGISGWIIQGWYWYVVYIVFAIFFVGRIHRSKESTLPGMLSSIHGPSIRPFVALYTYVNVVPIAYLVSFGWVANQVLGVSPPLAIILATVFVVLYSLDGGFGAIVRTDLVQCLLMYVSIGLVLFFCIKSATWPIVAAKLPPDHLSLTGKSSGIEMLSWLLIALSTLVDPNFYQRCFAAKSARQARIGVCVAIACWIAFDLCVTIVSLYARALFPNVAPQTGYLTLVGHVVPRGFYGLIISGIIATILSTVDSYLFVGAMTLSEDFSWEKKNDHVGKRKRPSTRTGLVISAILAVAMSSIYQGRIKTIWKTLGGLSSAGVLVPGIAAFTPFASEFAAKTALIVGGTSYLCIHVLGNDTFVFLLGTRLAREPLISALFCSLAAYVACYAYAPGKSIGGRNP